MADPITIEEITLTGEAAHQFAYLVERAETDDGSDPSKEAVAKQLLREITLQRYVTAQTDTTTSANPGNNA